MSDRVGRRGVLRVARSRGLTADAQAAAVEPAVPPTGQVDRVYIPKLKPMASLRVHIDRAYDKPGSAADILGVIKKHGLNLVHLDSKLHRFAYDGAMISMDIQGNGEVIDLAVQDIQRVSDKFRVEIAPPLDVPWFPISIKELDKCVTDTIGADDGGLVSPDHPGFNDDEYKRRRSVIADAANSFNFSYGERPPYIEYTEKENNTWRAVYEKLQKYHKRWACPEFLEVFPLLESECGYGPKGVPQLAHISDFLQSQTGFRLWPVCGLLSARDFLNCLAFRTFCSTQYIRHHANPFYTPEPDVCHELIGHVPLFADPNFAEFSQKVGLASLGASDEDILKLASIYWFTVEFGLVEANTLEQRIGEIGGRGEDSGVKVIGAGILSSFGEMEWAASKNPGMECREMGGIAKTHPSLARPNLVPFDPKKAAELDFPITTYQPTYFVGASLAHVKDQIDEYCDTQMGRSFHPVYDPNTHTVSPNRHIRRLPRSNEGMVEEQARKQQAYFENLEGSS